MGLETGVFDGKSRRGAVGIIDLQDRTHSILFILSLGRRVRTQQPASQSSVRCCRSLTSPEQNTEQSRKHTRE